MIILRENETVILNFVLTSRSSEHCSRQGRQTTKYSDHTFKMTVMLNIYENFQLDLLPSPPPAPAFVL